MTSSNCPFLAQKRTHFADLSLWFHEIFPDLPSKKWNGILLPKLFWPTLRKKCSSDGETLLKFEAEGREFAKILRSQEQFIQTVKGQNNFGNRMLF